MIKYADRGLANDRYYWNMNQTLLKTLFWVLNIAILSVNQGNVLVFYLKHGRSAFTNTYRLTCLMNFNIYFYVFLLGLNSVN